MNDTQRDELLTNMSKNVSAINKDVKSVSKKVGRTIKEVVVGTWQGLIA